MSDHKFVLPGGIRPYESLWSIVHRLIWLNRPLAPELNKFLGLNISNIRSRNSISLLSGHKFIFQKIEAIVTDCVHTQWEHSVLRDSLSDSASIFKYCQTCLSYGYHSIMFCYPGIEHCPIHGDPLVSTCRYCGRDINAHLDLVAIDNPYACSFCGASFLADASTLFDANNFDAMRILGYGLSYIKQAETDCISSGLFDWTDGDKISLGQASFLLHLIKRHVSPAKAPIWLSNDIHGFRLKSTYKMAFNGGSVHIDDPRTITFPFLYRSYLKYLLRNSALHKRSSSSLNLYADANIYREVRDSDKNQISDLLSILLFRQFFERSRKESLLYDEPVRNALYRRTQKFRLFENYDLFSLHETNAKYSRRLALGELKPDVASWIFSHLMHEKYSSISRIARQFATGFLNSSFDSPCLPDYMDEYLPFGFTVGLDRTSSKLEMRVWDFPLTSIDENIVQLWFDERSQRRRARQEHHMRFFNKW